ncbi:hypothetical protein [Dysgonomonas sp. GY617]|uniref:hypothetical protein n=1 Tax=Dysgonomonas sp. GY617 TaxID=2780420 RepID=UPI0018848736|nr:hypothetical protein [Dysgonomonas sp. GY617]MBF0578084.1 hypothetical protein [Dysgonomonas sp. GY617]
MLKSLHKIHSLIFYKWVRFVLSLDRFSAVLYTPSMEWVMYRAFFAVSFIQMTWFFILWTVGEIIFRKTALFFFEDQLIPAILICGVISIFNYFTLIYKKRWFKYNEEFAAYSKTKNKVINITILLFYILSFALFIAAFIIWGNLGDAGKIEGF